jgi:hypothetical protein
MGPDVMFVRNVRHGLIDIVGLVAGHAARFQIGSAIRKVSLGVWVFISLYGVHVRLDSLEPYRLAQHR